MSTGRLGLDEASLFAEHGHGRDRWRRTLREVGSPEALGFLADLEQGWAWTDSEAAALARTTQFSFATWVQALGQIAGHLRRDALLPAIRDSALACGANPASAAEALVLCLEAYGGS